MLARLVLGSVRHRIAALVTLVVLLIAGVLAARSLPIDAMPDVSTIQVSILTTAPGLSPVEVERTVTVPIENAMNGIQGGAELRSTSRAGLSAVTVVFADNMDVWFARQLILERLRGVEGDLPAQADTPQLGPVSTGLGEIFQFIVRSEQHTPMQLRTLLDWEIVPKLRSVPGIVEVNTQGGDLKEFHVNVHADRLRARKLSLRDVTEALRAANINVGGGYLDRGAESFTLRGEGLLKDQQDIENVVLRTSDDGTPLLVRQVADVVVSPALKHGVITADGKGEAVFGVALMILGANSKEVVAAVTQKAKEVQKTLPPGVVLHTVYDRSDFVGRTIGTVAKNLAEGVLIVTFVLAVFLGTLRGALAVVIGIPASMAVAIFGMHLFGVTGDLMSLGAIDFGFLVDGPIVMLEAVIAATAGRALRGPEKLQAFGATTAAVARPVAFAVAIIMLVYLPLLSLEGVEGKMFRPMALTMACALAGALLYAVVFFPAVLVTLVPPAKDHGPKWLEFLAHGYEAMLPTVVRWRWPLLAASTVLLLFTGWRFGAAGAEFVPRIFEGDAMVTIRRAPSIALEEAKRLDLETEKVLATFPEVLSSVAMTGRAEVATDPVGNDNTDTLIRLKPMEEWTTAHDFDALSEAIKQRVEAAVPGTFVSVSQPIEDKTNEMISGSRADVAIQIFGADTLELAKLADQVGDAIRDVPGAGDVRVERILGQPTLNAKADRARMARYGVKAEDAFSVFEASRAGVDVGAIYEQERRFALKVRMPPRAPTKEAIGELPVTNHLGEPVPLAEVASLTEVDGPTAIRRQNRERVVRIDVNLRGRDLISFVSEAQQLVRTKFPLASGYRVEWGGQFENFERAQKRLAIVVPVVVAIIFGMLLWMFGNARLALAVFALVPLSLTGGMAGLLARGMSFSLPAAVGFIALGGIGVLNGVVMATEVRRRLHEGLEVRDAVLQGSGHSLRAVLTTATVAALGFLPMAIATSAGAEVQRPLATAVIVGMLGGTLLTVMVLPGLLYLALHQGSESNFRE